ncbi:hypothetical protein EWH70_17855 [Amycolatopsis suaedae]|uniref:DUF559 domain-containing protein n=1 Tax=Amycolatopsis suaedae TaxID=2510978 RepID=A0A4Q7J5M8_9PSEU|nr:hypothetical protein EWH70_17855 [Amycolatopsis suaedae]
MLAERSRLGVIRVATLEALGMDSKTAYRWCLPGGPWQRLLPGIILLHNGEPSADQRAVAALMHGGVESQVTGVEACRRHGLRPRQLPDTDDIHLLVPHDRQVRSSGYVTIERTKRLPAPVTRGGIPLAPLVRAVTDAARRLRDEKQVAGLLIEGIQRGRCDPKSLAREVEAGTKRGTALPRRLLAEIDSLRSVAELHAREVAGRMRVPPTHWNAAVHGPSGRYLGRPDAWWDEVCLAWEIDSFDFHFFRDGYARTLERNVRYAGAGITVVQTLPSRLRSDPAGVLAELEAAYNTAAARPRPDVTLAA